MTGTLRGVAGDDPPLPDGVVTVVAPAFLCLDVDGDDGGIVAAVHVSVTGHSSDLTFFTAAETVTGGGAGGGGAAGIGVGVCMGRTGTEGLLAAL